MAATNTLAGHALTPTAEGNFNIESTDWELVPADIRPTRSEALVDMIDAITDQLGYPPITPGSPLYPGPDNLDDHIQDSANDLDSDGHIRHVITVDKDGNMRSGWVADYYTPEASDAFWCEVDRLQDMIDEY